MNRALRVVKVGGSLFDIHDLGERISAWLNGQPNGKTVFIAGGGPAVDSLRQRQILDGLSDEECHWRAIDTMSESAAMLQLTLPRTLLVRDLSECRARQEHCVLDVRAFMQSDAAGPQRLAKSFSATSDSIAAAIAGELGVGELVLLKSTLPEQGDLDGWVRSGFVDADFAQHARGLRAVRCVDLRTPPFREQTLAPSSLVAMP